MSWVRLDDQFAHHPKVLRAGPTASFLWLACIAYCQKFLTDGFVPEQAVATAAAIPDATECTERLVQCGLFERVDGGFQIHDFLEYNDSADQVKADRAWDKKRKALYSNPDLVLAIKTRDKNRCRYCSVKVNWADRRGPTGGQFDHIDPRGDNTLANLVVACRSCNSKKGNRLPESVGLFLQPVELVPNQNQSSSEPDLRARARSPSHPIHTKEQQQNGGPLFEGQRVVVMPFMQSALERILGSDADKFDLGAWYWKLDAKYAGKPITDMEWPWLKREMLKEARTRGLLLGSANEIAARERGNGHRVQQIGGTGCPHDPICQSNTACINKCIEDGRRERAAR